MIWRGDLGLTHGARRATLVEMRFGKAILMAGLAIALVAYAFDCGGMSTPEQAMECCKSMPCSSPGHQNQDCCKKMSVAHSPFVQAPAVGGAAFSFSAVAVLPASGEALSGWMPSFRAVPAHSHAPPGSSLLSPTPLRI